MKTKSILFCSLSALFTFIGFKCIQNDDTKRSARYELAKPMILEDGLETRRDDIALDQERSAVKAADSLSSLKQKYKNWGRTNGPEAIEHALRHHSGESGLNLALIAAEAWAELDVHAAADFIASLLVEGNDYLVYAFPQIYVNYDPNGAIDWAMNRVSHELREGAVIYTYTYWLDSDASEAILWTCDHFEDRIQLRRSERTALSEALRFWAQREPDAARRWAKALPLGDTRVVALESVVDVWVEAELEFVGDWLDALERDERLDSVYMLYAQRLVSVNSPNALLWANRVVNERARDRVIAMLSED